METTPKMSKRSCTTDVGSIAYADLSHLGAGKEGWLANDPNLLCALDTHSVALSNKFLILIINWANPNDSGLRTKIRPELSPIEAEYITAIEWLVFDEIRVIAVGTSKGYLLIFDLNGDLVHKQLVYSGRILKLRARGTKSGLTHDSPSREEVCIVMPGVIARFDGSDIQRMLQKWFEETNSNFWDQNPRQRDLEDLGNSSERLPYQLWNVNKYGSCADAAITGVMPPPLMESQSSQRYYCAVTVGDDAVISAFRLSEDRSKSLVGAILSKVVPVTFSTIASFSKIIWRSDNSPTKTEPKPQPFARASPLTCLKDHPRKGERLTLSPSGTLAAITDSLGRILLLDTQALVVVRLWKVLSEHSRISFFFLYYCFDFLLERLFLLTTDSFYQRYRDASCVFMEMLVKKDTLSSSSAYHVPEKSDYCLCLAIHAPRKGIIEVWQMRTGPRLLTIQCAKGSKILQPSYRFQSSMTSSPYAPLEVFLLNGDSGQLSVLNPTLN